MVLSMQGFPFLQGALCFAWLLPGSAEQHCGRTGSWAGVAVLPLKLELAAVAGNEWLGFCPQVRETQPGGAYGLFLVLPWGHWPGKHSEGSASWAAGPGCGFCGSVACLSWTSEAKLSSDQKLRFLTSQAPDEW